MERFDEIVRDIKGAWLATHKTVKDVEFIYMRYFHEEKQSELEVAWKEKNPERISKQIRDLFIEMRKLEHETRIYFLDYDIDDDKMYTVGVRVKYTERFDD